jgi:hypothetical protein
MARSRRQTDRQTDSHAPEAKPAHPLTCISIACRCPMWSRHLSCPRCAALRPSLAASGLAAPAAGALPWAPPPSPRASCWITCAAKRMRARGLAKPACQRLQRMPRFASGDGLQETPPRRVLSVALSSVVPARRCLPACRSVHGTTDRLLLSCGVCWSVDMRGGCRATHNAHRLSACSRSISMRARSVPSPPA